MKKKERTIATVAQPKICDICKGEIIGHYESVKVAKNRYLYFHNHCFRNMTGTRDK